MKGESYNESNQTESKSTEKKWFEKKSTLIDYRKAGWKYYNLKKNFLRPLPDNWEPIEIFFPIIVYLANFQSSNLEFGSPIPQLTEVQL